MKKMIIAAIATVFAIGVQAASCSWSTTGTIYKPDGTSILGTTYTAYLFDVATVSQGDLVTALRDGGSITDYSAMSSYTGSAVKVPSTSFTQDAGKTITAYFAIVMDDNVYISNSATKTTADVGAATFSMMSQSTNSQNTFDANTSYSSAGWYSTTAVPEPTSGLLLLLGMAGLALKRKQA